MGKEVSKDLAKDLSVIFYRLENNTYNRSKVIKEFVLGEYDYLESLKKISISDFAEIVLNGYFIKN